MFLCYCITILKQKKEDGKNKTSKIYHKNYGKKMPEINPMK